MASLFVVLGVKPTEGIRQLILAANGAGAVVCQSSTDGRKNHCDILAGETILFSEARKKRLHFRIKMRSDLLNCSRSFLCDHGSCKTDEDKTT